MERSLSPPQINKIHLHAEQLLQNTFEHWQKILDFEKGKSVSSECMCDSLGVLRC